jgi:hypothetical protein
MAHSPSLHPASRWYTPIECDATAEHPLVTGADDFGDIDPNRLRSGEAVRAWSPTLELRVTARECDGQPDDVLQDHIGSLPIYSARLREALDSHGIGGLQYLPVQIRRYDGSVIDGFAVANILNVVEALDLEQSRFSRFPDDFVIEQKRGQIREVRRPSLKALTIEGLDVIRLQEFPLYICVSQKFKTIFESGRFTGYSFREIDISRQ